MAMTFANKDACLLVQTEVMSTDFHFPTGAAMGRESGLIDGRFRRGY